MKSRRPGRIAFVAFRVAVSIGLVAYIFTSLIEYRDTVRLADNSMVTGRVQSVEETGVRIRTADGTERFLPAAELASEEEGAVVHYGFFSVVEQARPGYLAAGVAVFVAINILAFYRLWILLFSQGIVVRLRDVLRWHFIGLFYNTFLPGLTGGDLVKAYYAMRRVPDKRTAAVVTILVDRVIGIVALAFVAGAVLAFHLTDERLRQAALLIYSFLGIVAAGGSLIYSRRIRRLVRLDRLLAVLPFSGVLQKIDEAIFLFRYRKAAVGLAFALSIVSHTVTILVNYLLGQALGLDWIEPTHYFVFIPTILILTAIPISLGGIGWGEAMYVHFFGQVAAVQTADIGNRAVALSLTFRLTQILWSLPGGLFLLLGEERVSKAEMASEMADAADADEAATRDEPAASRGPEPD